MKGQWKTLEAIIAGVVILLFLAALNSVSTSSLSEAPPHGYRALQSLDEKGTLRGPVYDDDAATVSSLIDSTGYLTGFNHTVQICDEAGSCSGSRPSDADVWTYRLILSGEDVYEPKEVVLYVFR